MIEKILSRRFSAEDIGNLKRGETYVKMLNSVFNMTTERVADPPAGQWVDEIIAFHVLNTQLKNNWYLKAVVENAWKLDPVYRDNLNARNRK